MEKQFDIFVKRKNKHMSIGLFLNGNECFVFVCCSIRRKISFDELPFVRTYTVVCVCVVELNWKIASKELCSVVDNCRFVHDSYRKLRYATMRKVLAFAIEYFYIENQRRVSAVFVFSFLFILFADKYPLSNESAHGINQPILKCHDEREMSDKGKTAKVKRNEKKKNESNRNNMSIAHRRCLKGKEIWDFSGEDRTRQRWIKTKNKKKKNKSDEETTR